MKKRIFITGANGFIGSNLCEFFVLKGWEVFGLVRKSSDLHFLEDIKVNIVFGDLFSPENISFPEHIDYFIHNASIVDDNATKSECQRGIYDLTKNLVNIIKTKNVKKIIYISTCLTLGYGKENISEHNPGNSIGFLPYAVFKKKTEEYLLGEFKKNKLPVIIIRPGDVYGPRDRVSSLNMLKAIEKGIPLIVGNGNAKFAYCYVDNLCLAVYLACTKENLLGRSYTVTNIKNYTWKEFFSCFYKGLEKKQRIYVPAFLIFTFAVINQLLKKIFTKFKPDVNIYRIKRVIFSTTYDITSTVKDLGYKPDNNFEQQIKNIINWYNKEKTRKKN